ncbi:hypothetical protein Efla_003200 [Eimeria flavescens]
MHFGVGGDDTLLEARWKIQAGPAEPLPPPTQKLAQCHCFEHQQISWKIQCIRRCKQEDQHYFETRHCASCCISVTYQGLHFAMHGNNSKHASIEAAVAPRRPRIQLDTSAARSSLRTTWRTQSHSGGIPPGRGLSRRAVFDFPSAKGMPSEHYEVPASNVFPSPVTRSFSVTVGRLLHDLDPLTDPLTVLRQQRRSNATSELYQRPSAEGSTRLSTVQHVLPEDTGSSAPTYSVQRQIRLLMQLLPSEEQQLLHDLLSANPHQQHFLLQLLGSAIEMERRTAVGAIARQEFVASAAANGRSLVKEVGTSHGSKLATVPSRVATAAKSDFARVNFCNRPTAVTHVEAVNSQQGPQGVAALSVENQAENGRVDAEARRWKTQQLAARSSVHASAQRLQGETMLQELVGEEELLLRKQLERRLHALVSQLTQKSRESHVPEELFRRSEAVQSEKNDSTVRVQGNGVAPVRWQSPFRPAYLPYLANTLAHLRVQSTSACDSSGVVENNENRSDECLSSRCLEPEDSVVEKALRDAASSLQKEKEQAGFITKVLDTTTKPPQSLAGEATVLAARKQNTSAAVAESQQITGNACATEDREVFAASPTRYISMIQEFKAPPQQQKSAGPSQQQVGGVILDFMTQTEVINSMQAYSQQAGPEKVHPADHGIENSTHHGDERNASSHQDMLFKQLVDMQQQILEQQHMLLRNSNAHDLRYLKLERLIEAERLSRGAKGERTTGTSFARHDEHRVHQYSHIEFADREQQTDKVEGLSRLSSLLQQSQRLDALLQQQVCTVKRFVEPLGEDQPQAQPEKLQPQEPETGLAFVPPHESADAQGTSRELLVARQQQEEGLQQHAEKPLKEASTNDRNQQLQQALKAKQNKSQGLERRDRKIRSKQLHDGKAQRPLRQHTQQQNGQLLQETQPKHHYLDQCSTHLHRWQKPTWQKHLSRGSLPEENHQSRPAVIVFQQPQVGDTKNEVASHGRLQGRPRRGTGVKDTKQRQPLCSLGELKEPQTKKPRLADLAGKIQFESTQHSRPRRLGNLIIHRPSSAPLPTGSRPHRAQLGSVKRGMPGGFQSLQKTAKPIDQRQRDLEGLTNRARPFEPQQLDSMDEADAARFLEQQHPNVADTADAVVRKLKPVAPTTECSPAPVSTVHGAVTRAAKGRPSLLSLAEGFSKENGRAEVLQSFHQRRERTRPRQDAGRQHDADLSQGVSGESKRRLQSLSPSPRWEQPNVHLIQGRRTPTHCSGTLEADRAPPQISTPKLNTLTAFYPQNQQLSRSQPLQQRTLFGVSASHLRVQSGESSPGQDPSKQVLAFTAYFPACRNSPAGSDTELQHQHSDRQRNGSVGPFQGSRPNEARCIYKGRFAGLGEDTCASFLAFPSNRGNVSRARRQTLSCPALRSRRKCKIGSLHRAVSVHQQEGTTASLGQQAGPPSRLHSAMVRAHTEAPLATERGKPFNNASADSRTHKCTRSHSAAPAAGELEAKNTCICSHDKHTGRVDKAGFQIPGADEERSSLPTRLEAPQPGPAKAGCPHAHTASTASDSGKGVTHEMHKKAAIVLIQSQFRNHPRRETAAVTSRMRYHSGSCGLRATTSRSSSSCSRRKRDTCHEQQHNSFKAAAKFVLHSHPTYQQRPWQEASSSMHKRPDKEIRQVTMPESSCILQQAIAEGQSPTKCERRDANSTLPSNLLQKQQVEEKPLQQLQLHQQQHRSSGSNSACQTFSWQDSAFSCRSSGGVSQLNPSAGSKSDSLPVRQSDTQALLGAAPSMSLSCTEMSDGPHTSLKEASSLPPKYGTEEFRMRLISQSLDGFIRQPQQQQLEAKPQPDVPSSQQASFEQPQKEQYLPREELAAHGTNEKLNSLAAYSIMTGSAGDSGVYTYGEIRLESAAHGSIHSITRCPLRTVSGTSSASAGESSLMMPSHNPVTSPPTSSNQLRGGVSSFEAVDQAVSAESSHFALHSSLWPQKQVSSEGRSLDISDDQDRPIAALRPRLDTRGRACPGDDAARLPARIVEAPTAAASSPHSPPPTRELITYRQTSYRSMSSIRETATRHFSPDPLPVQERVSSPRTDNAPLRGTKENANSIGVSLLRQGATSASWRSKLLSLPIHLVQSVLTSLNSNKHDSIHSPRGTEQEDRRGRRTLSDEHADTTRHQQTSAESLTTLEYKASADPKFHSDNSHGTHELSGVHSDSSSNNGEGIRPAAAPGSAGADAYSAEADQRQQACDPGGATKPQHSLEKSGWQKGALRTAEEKDVYLQAASETSMSKSEKAASSRDFTSSTSRLIHQLSDGEVVEASVGGSGHLLVALKLPPPQLQQQVVCASYSTSVPRLTALGSPLEAAAGRLATADSHTSSTATLPLTNESASGFAAYGASDMQPVSAPYSPGALGGAGLETAAQPAAIRLRTSNHPNSIAVSLPSVTSMPPLYSRESSASAAFAVNTALNAFTQPLSPQPPSNQQAKEIVTPRFAERGNVAMEKPCTPSEAGSSDRSTFLLRPVSRGPKSLPSSHQASPKNTNVFKLSSSSHTCSSAHSSDEQLAKPKGCTREVPCELSNNEDRVERHSAMFSEERQSLHTEQNSFALQTTGRLKAQCEVPNPHGVKPEDLLRLKAVQQSPQQPLRRPSEQQMPPSQERRRRSLVEQHVRGSSAAEGMPQQAIAHDSATEQESHKQPHHTAAPIQPLQTNNLLLSSLPQQDLERQQQNTMQPQSYSTKPLPVSLQQEPLHELRSQHIAYGLPGLSLQADLTRTVFLQQEAFRLLPQQAQRMPQDHPNLPRTGLPQPMQQQPHEGVTHPRPEEQNLLPQQLLRLKAVPFSGNLEINHHELRQDDQNISLLGTRAHRQPELRSDCTAVAASIENARNNGKCTEETHGVSGASSTVRIFSHVRGELDSEGEGKNRTASSRSDAFKGSCPPEELKDKEFCCYCTCHRCLECECQCCLHWSTLDRRYHEQHVTHISQKNRGDSNLHAPKGTQNKERWLFDHEGVELLTKDNLVEALEALQSSGHLTAEELQALVVTVNRGFGYEVADSASSLNLLSADRNRENCPIRACLCWWCRSDVTKAVLSYFANEDSALLVSTLKSIAGGFKGLP